MHVKYYSWLLTFFGALMSSYGLKCAGQCSSTTVNITLGSEVLLPCSLGKSYQTYDVNWSHNSTLVSIRPQGNITFEDCRDGRVMVFPNLFERGNFSISMHGLQASDLGTYCCQLSTECHIVELKYSPSTVAGWHLPWYYILAGVGGLILLVITCSLIYEFGGLRVKKSTESYNVNSPQNQEANPPGNRQRARENESSQEAENGGQYEDMTTKYYETMRAGQREDLEGDEEDYVNAERGPDGGHYANSERTNPRRHRGQTGHHKNRVVYENDEHDPTGPQIRPQPQNRDFSETQSPPRSRAPYYVNHSEICNPSTAVKSKKQRKKKKLPPAVPTEYQFRNPIYGDSSVAPKTDPAVGMH